MQNRSVYSAWIISDGSVNSAGAASAVFPWWSFTKTVIAIGALRLVDQGRLDLDAVMPGKPYTLRQLLQHRAGVPDYYRLRAYQDAVARNDAAWSRDRLLSTVGADRLSFQPGAGWAYSNVGYMFVREIIEGATGLPLGAALEKLVFGPLGVRSVRLATAPLDFADVFWPDLRGYDPRWAYHGCLIGTPMDAAAVLNALFRGQILTSDSLGSMLQRHDLGGAVPGRPWTACGYGLGLMSGRMGVVGRAIGHTGGGPHSTNAVYHFPDLAVPVTVATFIHGEDQGAAEGEAVATALRLAR
ncbi:serine hydrolase domain-containing protein [Inquilinus sp. CA228]|uniref:serine hydrolase domain-containing protein n=1 Tax=Inquilinus sp. CA228 TaxID=3455609 RepID=UPI003F8D209A